MLVFKYHIWKNMVHVWQQLMIDVCGIGMWLKKIKPGRRDHILGGCEY